MEISNRPPPKNRQESPGAEAPDKLPNEAVIRSIVHSFYGEVRRDDLLAPVFEPRLREHWQEHLEIMVDFWSSIILTSGRYRGRPLAIHRQLGKITPAMWSRWLELFSQASRKHCSEAVAQIFDQRARQIADHLSRTLDSEPTFPLRAS